MPPAVSFLCHFPSAFAAWVAPASCPSVSGLSSSQGPAVTRPARKVYPRPGHSVRVRLGHHPTEGGTMKRLLALAVFLVAGAVAAGVAFADHGRGHGGKHHG